MTFLVSPTISRFTPLVDDKVGGTKGRERIVTRQGSISILSTVITMMIEAGPVIKGVHPIEITCEGVLVINGSRGIIPTHSYM